MLGLYITDVEATTLLHPDCCTKELETKCPPINVWLKMYGSSNTMKYDAAL